MYIATRKKKVADEANKQLHVSTKKKEPKKTRKVEADADGREVEAATGQASGPSPKRLIRAVWLMPLETGEIGAY